MLCKRLFLVAACFLFMILVSAAAGNSADKNFRDSLYQSGLLKPTDSELKVKIGDRAPAFSLPSLKGEAVSLAQFAGKKNVVISFVPAAWTPVCSDQWPGYVITRDLFDQYNATLIGITVDNIPTLHAWTRQMGNVWFEVLSDFWPHGDVADRYGLLRSDGTSERALIFIDMDGFISGIHVSDINVRPSLELLVEGLKNMN
jgi:peroxiredoxin